MFDSLVTDRVFCAVLVDGTSEEMSLVDLVSRADTIAHVAEPPEIYVTVVRVLGVAVARSVAPREVFGKFRQRPSDLTDTSLAKTMQAFPWSDIASATSDYLTRHADWFSLSNSNGLYQVEGMVISREKKDNSHKLFPSHGLKVSSASMTLADTGKYMLAAPLLGVGGKQIAFTIAGVERPAPTVFKVSDNKLKDPSYPLGFGALVHSPLSFAEGRTLSETILMSITPELMRDSFTSEPVWELSVPYTSPYGDASGDRIRGPISALTYPLRFTWIQVDGGRVVNAAVVNGDGRTSHALHDYDTMVSMEAVTTEDGESGIVHEKDEYGFLRYVSRGYDSRTEPMQPWESVASILPCGQEAVMSDAVRFAARYRQVRADTSPLRVVVVSALTAAQQAKIMGIFKDTIRLPRVLVGGDTMSPAERRRIVTDVLAEINRLDTVEGRLRSTVKRISLNSSSSKSKGRLRSTVKRISLNSSSSKSKGSDRSSEYAKVYRRALEPQFRTWLAALDSVEWGNADEVHERYAEWQRIVATCAINVLNTYTGTLSNGQWESHGVRLAYMGFYKQLRDITPEFFTDQKKKKDEKDG